MTSDATGVLAANGLTGAAATDPGRTRDHNEDVFYIDLDAGIFLVVDGVGGQAGGDVAAGIAETTIRRRLERRDSPADVLVRESITLANQAILRRAESTPALSGMACVLTLAVLEGQELTIGHVGDSRMYKLDARGITKLTHDHSPVGEQEDARQISETEAMRHARRNEVFRDVGSEARHPESPDFIELVQTRFDADAAIVICSDGLTDMLPALEINRLVRLHAGSPDDAVAALIAAANAVGGRDNITVVLVEGPAFGATPDGGRSFPPPALDNEQIPTVPLGEIAPSVPAAEIAPRRGSLRRVSVAVLRSRALALIVGTILGLGVSVVAAGRSPLWFLRAAPRQLIVGTGSEAFPTIGAALASARAGDIVQVDAGEYAEAITIPAGVELRAATAGSAVLVAPEGEHDWTAITAGAPGAVIRGLRIAGTAQAPIDHGIVVTGGDVQIDDVGLDGEIRTGIDIAGPGAVVRASRFDRVAGVPVHVQQTDTVLRQNVFTASGSPEPAIRLDASASPSIHYNVFAHFDRAIDRDGVDDDLAGDNFVVEAAPHRWGPGR